MTESPSSVLQYECAGLVDASGQSVPWPRFGVIGDPVAHSLSPRLHEAALKERGIDETYRALRVASGYLPQCLEAARAAGVRGLNVTLPHKTAALAFCTRRSEEAESIGAANTLVARADGWQGHNTDARGLALALERTAGRRLRSFLNRGVILGAGGAARAAAYSLTSLGVRELFVLARSPEKAAWIEDAGQGTVATDESVLARAGVVVQCTPLGWRPEDPSPVDLSPLAPGCLVADLVYAPTPSRLLTTARDRGCLIMDGLPMLVAQAALAFAMWHGATAPLTVMAAAVGLRWKI